MPSQKPFPPSFSFLLYLWSLPSRHRVPCSSFLFWIRPAFWKLCSGKNFLFNLWFLQRIQPSRCPCSIFFFLSFFQLAQLTRKLLLQPSFFCKHGSCFSLLFSLLFSTGSQCPCSISSSSSSSLSSELELHARQLRSQSCIWEHCPGEIRPARRPNPTPAL